MNVARATTGAVRNPVCGTGKCAWLRFFHAQDAALMGLIGPTGSVTLLSLGGWFPRRRLLQGKSKERPLHD